MEKRKVRLTIWIASKEQNAWMKAADLKPEYKVYAHPQSVTTEIYAHLTDEQALTMILNTPYRDEKFWIPAAEIDDTMAVVDGIMEISDGNKIMFIPPTKKEESNAEERSGRRGGVTSRSPFGKRSPKSSSRSGNS